ncbi:MAG: HD domain-containing protein [Chloroflexota bacterium]|nr:HD domain-containing protein [Chloroflexota bacterium]
MRSTFDEARVLAQTYDEVQACFMGSDDLAHGWEHIDRVYKLARSIAEREGADSFIVGMATLLHDLGRTKDEMDEHGRHVHHADLSVALAGELLARYQVPVAQREAIVHAIVAHSFSKGIEPRTLEARVVRDADRLDGLGAIGILRWALTGALRRTPNTQSYHPEDPFAERHTLDDSHYMLDHFYSKLLKLADTMSTETGRELARRRTDFMRVYLDEFRRELDFFQYP